MTQESLMQGEPSIILVETNKSKLPAKYNCYRLRVIYNPKKEAVQLLYTESSCSVEVFSINSSAKVDNNNTYTPQCLQI